MFEERESKMTNKFTMFILYLIIINKNELVKNNYNV